MMAKLMDEIGKKKPFDCLELEVFLNVLRTAEALSERLSPVLKQFNLSPTQYNVLRILRGAGACCCNTGIACREISDRMVTRDPDMTRLLDRMEKAGLIQRERSKDDRRVVKTSITEEGLRLLKEMDEPVIEAHCQLLRHMGEEKLRQLSELLELARQEPA